MNRLKIPLSKLDAKAMLQQRRRPNLLTLSICEKIGHQRPPIEHASIERDIAMIRAKLNDFAFSSPVAKGRTLPIADAVTLALEH